MIEKIFEIIATPTNNMLNYFPFQVLRPLYILAFSGLLGYLSTHPMMKFRWIRIIALSFAFYLAFDALGVR